MSTTVHTWAAEHEGMRKFMENTAGFCYYPFSKGTQYFKTFNQICPIENHTKDPCDKKPGVDKELCAYQEKSVRLARMVNTMMILSYFPIIGQIAAIILLAKTRGEPLPASLKARVILTLVGLGPLLPIVDAVCSIKGAVMFNKASKLLQEVIEESKKNPGSAGDNGEVE